MLNCLITGVGGQGTVLLSRLIGEAALNRGLDVRGSETIGMAQRGGSVTSHLRIGEGSFSPLIPPGRADLIMAFECAEAVRVLPYLAPTGKMLALDRALVPGAGSPEPYRPADMMAYLDSCLGDRLTVVSWEGLVRDFDPRVSNVLLLGRAIAGGFLPFSVAEIIDVLRLRVSPKFLALNIRALQG
ncbi:MAG: indolepyruvate oxidoreductase subunit beta [Treponema sp.]|jgi:indolepyruvate ferredoxin oxidoreductase beta subunit|nr:indolepyruvate oxidoreductase subunit beta [Treponema sp.]